MFVQDDHRSLADRRADATRDAVLEAAWRLSRRDGLTGWSLRGLATEVGLAAPSLYAYFDSKHAIYDAMFRDGYEAFDRAAGTWEDEVARMEPRAALRRVVQVFFEFCTGDPTRYQLMFQRVIPDFTPSDHAYAASVASYERFRARLAELGASSDEDLDLWTALATGLVDQQISNDPGGDRWHRLADAAVDMFCDHVGIPPEGDTTP